MVAGHLREKRGIYHMILSYTNENGERVTPTKSTGLPVKGNKKRAEAMLNDWRKSEEIALKKRKANGSLKKLDPNQEILFTKFMLDWLEMMKTASRLRPTPPMRRQSRAKSIHTSTLGSRH